jgi:soluble lytic murein transglycosylase-like protein
VTWATLAIAAMLAARAPVPFEAEIDAAVAETAAVYPVPKALVIAVISVESDFRPRAVSRAGAKGLMQLMPNTALRVGISERELFEAAQNIRGGVRLLSVLLRHYDGDLISALVAYNARPRKLFAPVPRNNETPTYVWRVLAQARAVSMQLDLPFLSTRRRSAYEPQARDEEAMIVGRDAASAPR